MENQEIEKRIDQEVERRLSELAKDSVVIIKAYQKRLADMFIEKSQERTDFKEKIRISDNGKDDAFSDAIIDYLEDLPDNNRKIEACYNIIKICKRIAVDLQAGKDIA